MFSTDTYKKTLCPESENFACKRPYCPFYSDSDNHQSTYDVKNYHWLDRGSSLWKLSHFDFVPVQKVKCKIDVSGTTAPSITMKSIETSVDQTPENKYEQITTASSALRFFPSDSSPQPPKYAQVYAPKSSIPSLCESVVKSEPDEEIVFVAEVQSKKDNSKQDLGNNNSKRSKVATTDATAVTSTTDETVNLIDKQLAEKKREVAEMEAKLAEFEKIERKKAELEARLSRYIPENKEELSRPLKKKPAIEEVEEDEGNEMPLPPQLKRPKIEPKTKTTRPLPPRDAYVPTPLELLKKMDDSKEKQSDRELTRKWSTEKSKVEEMRPSTSTTKQEIDRDETHVFTEDFLQDLFGESNHDIKPRPKKNESLIKDVFKTNDVVKSKQAMKRHDPKKREETQVPTSKSQYEEKRTKFGLTEEQLNAAKKLGSQQSSRVVRSVDKNTKPLNPVAQLGARLEKATKGASSSTKPLDVVQEKGKPRVAHVPSSSTSTSRLLEPSIKKFVPTKTRLSCVNSIFAELRQKHGADASMDEAMEEELKILKSATHLKGYQQKVVSARIRIRGASSSTHDKKSVSHQANLIGPKAGEISINVRDKRKSLEQSNPAKMSQEMFYSSIKKYLLSMEELEKNCYPFWTNSEKTEVVIAESQWDIAPGREGRDKRFIADDDLERHCSRCGKRFFLNKHGEIVEAECYFHPLRMKKKRENKALVSHYPCCDGRENSLGCSLARGHVSEAIRHSELLKFRQFERPTGADDRRSRQVYALDCEMVYTVWGPALARISVVDRFDKLVLDIKILPEYEIIDANTRFSGLTIEELKKEGRTWDEAQRRLDQIINSHTILIGHSLESDLKAMHIVHKRVVDTAMVFPHKFENHKWSLKDLASEKLQKIIQEDVDGHDSKEDSSTCMQLMLYELSRHG